MFETMVSFLLVEHIGGSLFDPPIGDPGYRRATTPHRRPYRTADGYVSALIYNDKQWRRFVAIAGSPEVLQDARFATLETRALHIDDVYEAVGRVMPGRSTADWIAALQEAGIPAVPVKSLKDVMDDPHLAQTGFFQTRDTKEGRVRFPGIPTGFSKTPGNIREAGPRLGEHTVEILEELGLSPDEMEACLASRS